VIIDSADFRKKPGSIFTFSADRVCEGVSFSTHKMPARILVDYLRNSFDCEVSIVCIQPKTIDFGRPISSAVNRAAKDAAKDILKAIDRGR
jgi:hydrogenase maturation protease